jgi:hypothetical protein
MPDIIPAKEGLENLSPEEFMNHMEALGNNMAPGNPDNLFALKDGDIWLDGAKKRDRPRMLFGELWFESELTIFFADTNLGKSILAVQIADSIAKCQPIKGFELEARAQTVIYYDFELNDKQFENRYSNNFTDHYRFGPNFLRAEINPEADLGDRQFESFLMYSIEQNIVEYNVKILIIDNITYLRNETEKAKDALPLMKMLKSLKTRFGLSILVLAHTPKRDLSKPITRNDLQGSKMLMNFCDSAFSLGESTIDKSVRYIKQIKARNCEIRYDSNNVILCQVVKPGNFLRFDYLDNGTEREHLREVSDKDQDELTVNVLNLIRESPGISAYAISKQLCTDESKFNSFNVKISRILKRLKATGQI